MVTLQQPQELLISSYLDFIEEMRQLNEKIWEGTIPRPNEIAKDFVSRLLDEETHPSPGMVAETTYWACEGNKVVGRIGLRHTLSESLNEFGGHIGYEVRPSCRKRGIAREMLKLVLQTSKAKAIGKILLTCAPSNIASNKTILANGGVLEKTAFVEKWHRDTNYYWINVTNI
jgi:predicted acetyltransferase